MASCVLGLDLGTTSVKCVVIDQLEGQVLAVQSQDTQAGDGGEQDVVKILSTLQDCVQRLPSDLLARVTKIGVCGQMHGVVLWRQRDVVDVDWNERIDVEGLDLSPLYTWRDSRCSSEFLAGLPPAESHLRVASGYGCATLFWLSRNRPHLFAEEGFDRAGTVADLVVALLCGLDRPAMSLHNAASWGYFDTVGGVWNEAALAGGCFPLKLLPRPVVAPGAAAGRLRRRWLGVGVATPLLAALGDMQCGVFSILGLENRCTAVLNVSTSAQLSFVMEPPFRPTTRARREPEEEAVEYVPYFNDTYLAVAASLNGGNVMQAFVRMLQSWTADLGVGAVSTEHVWSRVVALAEESDAADDSGDDAVVDVRLFGERHLVAAAPAAGVANLTPSNAGLGRLSRAIGAGIVANLHRMMSMETLRRHGVVELVGVGSALARNASLRRRVAAGYAGVGFRMASGGGGDAAHGAALAARALL